MSRRPARLIFVNLTVRMTGARYAPSARCRDMFFAYRDINRLAVHAALTSLAWSLAGIFFVVYLLRAGLPPAQIFLALAAILAFRFALRPLVLAVALRIVMRRTLILGTFLSAFQF